MNSKTDVVKASQPTSSSTLAFEDIEFLKGDDLRPVRLQLELLKPQLIMEKHAVNSTVVVFGSARIPSPEQAIANLTKLEEEAEERPEDRHLQKALAQARLALENSRYYEEAREFARIVSSTCQCEGNCQFVMITGGGPGIMEAANRGAHEVEAKSIGLGITLPHEQELNPYVTPELDFQFQYFALRKMHFLLRAKALVAFPGGFGTLDELFETLTLIQTKKTQAIPVLLFGKSYWQRLLNLEFLAQQGMISPQDLKLFHYVETAAEAWQEIQGFYGLTE